jgi:hypothetical protein
VELLEEVCSTLLPKNKNPLKKLFCFTLRLSLYSTAVVAERGVTQGHSELGDLLCEGFATFREHVLLDRPLGVEPFTQYTGATEKLEAFKLRYPNGKEIKSTSSFTLKETIYLAQEDAFLIDPRTYSDWLLQESKSMLKDKLHVIEDFVIQLEKGERYHLKTQTSRSLSFDKVVFTAGSYSRFWKELFPGSKLESSKPVQGSYLEFQNVEWTKGSFALTLNGLNLIWNLQARRLLIGATTLETALELAPKRKLKEIFTRVQTAIELPLPPFETGIVRVGLREKAQKREPYIVGDGGLFFLGGFYKNGYSLSLKMAKTLSHQCL